MNENEVKEALVGKAFIQYKGAATYQLLGVGKGKLDDGSWFKGAAYLGEDNVYYVGPYHMFQDFERVSV